MHVLALTTLDRFIPCFTGLDQALAAPRPSMLKVSVTAGKSGPIIILAGKADQASHTELAEILDAQLSGQATHLTIEVSRLYSADPGLRPGAGSGSRHPQVSGRKPEPHAPAAVNPRDTHHDGRRPDAHHPERDRGLGQAVQRCGRMPAAWLTAIG